MEGMERRGTLRSWNDAKGFGFIQAEVDGAQVFVHISAMRGDSRPRVGDAVLYVAAPDSQGRLRAQHMRHVGLSLDRPAIRRKPVPAADAPGRRRSEGAGIHNLPAKLLILAALAVLPAWGSLALLGQGIFWVALAYALLSLFSFCQYWLDKQSAQKGRWRTPENSLHIAELAGGWPGALVAQQVFRHKTRKVSFQLVFWAIVALHQAFWLDRLALGGRYLGHLLPF
ncbi:DUF1294 domain-containing protein [Pseudomonas alcaligenes]|uniref:DUF1294 domain-containing protein n=1 Tax=Aquipseudomonas alcaligenes TaxID=43263 RepID=UPI00358E0DE0